MDKRRRLSDLLRLEVHRRSVGPIHVEGHRDMLVRDHPLAVDLAIANGRAHPDVGFRAVGPFPVIRLRQ